MASAIDLTALDLNPEEALAASEAIFERVYVKSGLSNFHAIMTGIQMQKQIPFFGLMPMVGKASSGCTPNSVAGVAATQKLWNPKLMDFRLPHCQADVDQLFKMWKRSRQAMGTWEEVDNEMLAFLVDRAKDTHMEAIYRLTSFSNTLADNVTDGGEITDGVDPDYFNLIDGLWKQVFAAVTAGLSYRYTITENGGVSKTAQMTLDAERALNVFRNLHDNIDPRAFDGGTLKYQVTRSLLSNWQALLEDKSLANAVLSNVESKHSTPYAYRGIPIEVRYDWDRNIKAYFDQGATYLLPHRAILTFTENIPIGTSDEESMSSIDSFYDKKDRQWYLDGASMFDVKLLEEYALAAAY